VEHVIREENILAVYILIEGFCEVISERMLAIENQKARGGSIDANLSLIYIYIYKDHIIVPFS